LLPDDITLQANDRVKNIVSATMVMDIFFVILYSEFDNTLDLVNKVQYDRVILIRRRLVISTEPHFTRLYQQPYLLIHTHQLPMRNVLLLIADEDDL